MDQESHEKNWARIAELDLGLAHWCSAKRGRRGTPIGTSRGVSSHVDKENCSSSDGKEVSPGGARERDSGGTEAGDIA